MRKILKSGLCGVLALTIALSNSLVGIVSGADSTPEATKNWAKDKSYTSDVPAKHYHDRNDPSLTKLTDGLYAPHWNDNNIVGFYAKAPAEGPKTFTLDLGEQNYPITNIVVSGFGDNSVGIGSCDVLVEYQTTEMLGTNEWATGISLNAPSVEGGPYQVAAPVSFSAAKVRFVISGTNTWTFLDELELWGPAADYLAAYPVVTRQMNREVLVPTGKGTVLSIDAESTDGGILEYQWYKDGSPLEGEVNPSLSITSASAANAGRYQVKVYNVKGEYRESVYSETCDVFVKNVSESNLLFGIPFTTSMTYGDPSSSLGNYVDADPRYPSEILLTDGLRQEDGSSSGIRAGRYYNSYENIAYADFIFDLGSVKTFEQLNLRVLSGAGGVVPPTRARVHISNTANDDDWKLVFDGKLTSLASAKEYVFATQNDTKISAQYVKVDVYFDKGDVSIAIDEIELWAETTGQKPDAILGGVENHDDLGNLLSYNAAYTANKNSPDDTSNTQLTNGTMGTLLGLGWNRYASSSGNLEFIVDLNREVSFEQVEMHFLKDAEKQAAWPEWVKVEYSTDNSVWNTMTQEDLDKPMETPIYVFHAVSEIALNAKYIKVTIPNTENVYLDEIQVLKERTVIVSEPEAEEIDPNNLAYGRKYTSLYPASPNYPDKGGLLTNGKRGGSAYLSPQWYAYHSTEGSQLGFDKFYLTIDLGSVKTFEQIKMGILINSGVGIMGTSHIKVEYSTDNEHWEVLSDEDTNWGNADQVKRYVVTADEPVSGQYVRIHYKMDGWLFVDEVEVLAVADSNEDIPDNNKEINLVRGFTNYSISRTQDIGETVGLLTDGRYGTTYTTYDPNWMGFKSGANNHVVMEFDLYGTNSVSEIVFSSRYDPSKKLTLPQNLTISVQNGLGQWAEIKSFPNTLPSSASDVELT